eukprot:3397138-Lingulodinium_polyedra.AAC.1
MLRTGRRFAGAAGRKSNVWAREWSSRARGLQAVSTAERRFDRIFAQRFRTVAQWCGRVGVPRPQWHAYRAVARP